MLGQAWYVDGLSKLNSHMPCMEGLVFVQCVVRLTGTALAVGRRVVQRSPGVLKETLVLFGRESITILSETEIQ